MPLRRRFTAKFPTARIKKIMQLDEEVGKLSATVPPVVSRALELFIEEIMTKSYQLTEDKSSRTILPSYLKHIIESTPSFEFLKPLVTNVADLKKEKSESNNVDHPSASKRGRPRRSVNDSIPQKNQEKYKRSLSTNDANNDSDSIGHDQHPKKFRITFRRDTNSTSVDNPLADDQNHKSLSYTSHFDSQVCRSNSEHAHDQF